MTKQEMLKILRLLSAMESAMLCNKHSDTFELIDALREALAQPAQPEPENQGEEHMTKDDIIRMAREAGFLIDTHAQQYQPNCILSTHGLIDENLQRFANLVAAHEREACAKVCKPQEKHDDPLTSWKIAEAIRARGTT